MEKKTTGIEYPKNIILGSGSPRRKQLLESIGLDFKVETSTIEESWPEGLHTEKVAEYLARLKAESLTVNFPDSIIITADTIVVFAGKIMGKPSAKEEAFKMISTLSGKYHEVITGVCIQKNSNIISFSDMTRVQFKDLSASEIMYYIDHFAPFDKAGAYGVQEWIGMIGITNLEGSYFNVMGLPVHKVYEALVNWNSNVKSEM